MFEVVGEKVLHEAKWLRLVQYDYTTPEGATKSWELAQRTTRVGTTDAVDILAIISKGDTKKIVLVKQFRPPLKGWTIEMPAGLVDPDEAIETTAIRELEVEHNIVCHSLMVLIGGDWVQRYGGTQG